MKKSFFRTLIILLIILTIPFPAYADYGPIQIDNYYDDWEDKPHTEVYPGKNPPEKKINYVSLFRDESNVYVHVIFAQSNNQDITNMDIELETNLDDEDYYIVPDTAPEENNGSASPEQESNADPEPEEQTLFSGRLQESIFIVAENEIDAENPSVQEPAAGAEDETEPVDQPADDGQEAVAEPTDQPADDGQEAVAEPTDQPADDGQEAVAEPTDQGEENSQGEETEPTDQDISPDAGNGPVLNEEIDDEGPGDLMDLFDPEYNVEPGEILDQLSPAVIEDSEIGAEDEELNGNLNLKKPGFYGVWTFSVWNGEGPVGSGYYTRSEGEPDELELYIPLSSIMSEYDGITEISMVIKKLGKQEILCVGASTAPLIGIAAGAGIAMFSVGAYTYRKKRLLPLIHGK
ncbi:MAG: hypothetical protein PHC91_04285 [Eubacteriales bacterium]|nr:hypothetical protein [Eubacteriales bacterium]